MPPRPSSVQSDGSLHPAMSQSPMAQDRGMLQYKTIHRDSSYYKSNHCLLLFALFQGLFRETLRCLLMAPHSQPLLCHHVSPREDRCTLGWAHISRTTPWVATDNREDNMFPKVCTLNGLCRGLTLER